MDIHKRIAMYLRLSLEDRDVDGTVKSESNSIESQRSLITSYINEREEFDDSEVLEFADDGFRGVTFDRPRFNAMMQEARHGKIDIIIVKDFSRFGRDYLEVGNYLERIFPLLGIRFISINDQFDSDSCQGMTGGMSIALKNILNTMYSRDLSVKCSSALKTHAQNGEYVASFPPYGYRKDPKNVHKLIIDPEAADTVRRIFTMAAAGMKKAEICRQLNEEDVETPTEHLRSLGFRKSYAKEKSVKLWSVSSISLMLKNETYLGKCIYNKRRHPHTGSRVQLKNDRSEWIIVENTHEPIITEELFREANQKAFTNKPHTYTHTKQCALLECPYCGRAVSRSNKSQIYRCHSGSHSGSEDCRNNHIAAHDLETAVLASTRKMAEVLLGNITETRHQLTQSAGLEDQLENYEKEKVQLSSRKLKIYDSYRSGRSTREKYMEDLEHLKDRLAMLDSLIAQTNQAIEDHREELSVMSDSAGKLSGLAALDTFDKEKLSLLIKKIYVYGPERIEILWNVDDIFWKEDLSEREDVAVETS